MVDALQIYAVDADEKLIFAVSVNAAVGLIKISIPGLAGLDKTLCISLGNNHVVLRQT